MPSIVEMPITKVPNTTSPHSGSDRNAYLGVAIVLLAVALLGTAAAVDGGLYSANLALLEVAVTLGLTAGVLFGVTMAQTERAKLSKSDESVSTPPSPEKVRTPEQTRTSSNGDNLKLRSRLTGIAASTKRWFRRLGVIGIIRVGTAAAGLLAIGFVLLFNPPLFRPTLLEAGITAALCLVASGLAATAVRYFAHIEPAQFPEAPGLSRGALVVAWSLVLAAISTGLAWAGQQTAVRILNFVVLTVNVAVCYGLLVVKQPGGEAAEIFPLNLGVLSILGSRPNVLASVLDAAERQLGIDLRSTWALTVVRRSLEPLIVILCLVGWLSTSLTVVGMDEQGLVERLGVPLAGQPLSPGLHLHWPGLWIKFFGYL